MKVRIFWVGKTKERYLNEGINRYLDLLGHMANVSINEIKEEKGRMKEKALFIEGERILRQTDSYFLLDERGKEFNSLEFAEFIKEKGNIDFVIGGPYGVSEDVRKNALSSIAMSRMTFNHEIVRLIFLEQLYRALTIIKGREYHH